MYSAQMEEYAKALEIYEQVRLLLKNLNLYSTNNICWNEAGDAWFTAFIYMYT